MSRWPCPTGGDADYTFSVVITLWTSVTSFPSIFLGVVSLSNHAPRDSQSSLRSELPCGVLPTTKVNGLDHDFTPRGRSQICDLKFAIWNPEGPAHALHPLSPRRTAEVGRRGPGRRFAPWSIGNWRSGSVGGGQCGPLIYCSINSSLTLSGGKAKGIYTVVSNE